MIMEMCSISEQTKNKKWKAGKKKKSSTEDGDYEDEVNYEEEMNEADSEKYFQDNREHYISTL